MVRLIRESHSLYDAFGVVIDDGREAWIIYCDSEYNAKYVKRYLDQNLDDITYTLETAAEVADYLQSKLLNYAYFNTDLVPNDVEEETETIKFGHTLIKIKDWYYI